jgi:transglutaminase-like putative cysteine protease
VAVAVSAALLALGLAAYVLSLPTRPPVGPLVTDAVTLVTGRTLLQVTNVDLWVLGVAPGPLFLSAYFGLRRRYVSATLVGGGTLAFLVLTGDAGNVITLLGVVGAVTAVGVGDAERRGDDIGAAESLAVLVALMILIPAFATVVPGGPSRTISGTTGTAGSGAGTVEASLVNAGGQISAAGNISLSPEVRFRVESDRETYWQVGAYDRYTGDGWVRTGGTSNYNGGRLQGPPGEARTIDQEYTLLDDVSVLPTAWQPVRLSGSPVESAQITSESGFTADGTVAANTSYTVRSRVPVSDAERLRTAGDDYPAEIEERYTRIPSSTPDRLAERTSTITANADNAYDTARVVERWLENNKNYSLDVERPESNMADEFVFEMEAGYCTYFATAMVTMLRSQGIPARFVVGYTPGERVSEDEWVVRGLNAHAWVQVYFPDVGWVRFDPTPAGPRETTELSRIQQARENNRTDVDTNDTGGPEWTPTPTATPAPLTPPPQQGNPVGTRSTPNVPTITPPPGIITGTIVQPNETTTPNGTTAAAVGDGGDGDDGFEWPSREEATLVGIAIFGLAVGIRRSGVAGRVYRALWVRYQPRADPETDAERAFERLEYLLAERYRPRRPGETPRQYLRAIGADERAERVALVYERARYAGEVTRDEADRAVQLVDELVPKRPTG